MAKEKSNPIISIGTSLVLVVFIILAFVTFAMMSAVSANTDYGSSRKAADRTTAYYKACSTANKKLSDIDAVLKQEYALNPGGYMQSAYSKVKTVRDVNTGENMAYFAVPISETKELYVEFGIVSPTGDSPGYKLNSMVERQTTKWQSDETLKLIK